MNQATESRSIERCEEEIYREGTVLAVFDAFAAPMEAFVEALRLVTAARLDWHYVGGRAVLKHIGKPTERHYLRLIIAGCNAPNVGLLRMFGEGGDNAA